MCTQVTKWGNSLAIRLPKPLADELDLDVDSEVTLTVSNGKIIITPNRRRYSLDELLAGITDANCHEETSTGEAVGAEVI